jgi:hypothetical protein
MPPRIIAPGPTCQCLISLPYFEQSCRPHPSALGRCRPAATTKHCTGPPSSLLSPRGTTPRWPPTPLHTAPPCSLKGVIVAMLPTRFSSPNRTARDPPLFPPSLLSNPSTRESLAPSKSEPPSPFIPHRGELRLCLFFLCLVVDLSLPSVPSCCRTPPPSTRIVEEAPARRNRVHLRHLL